jgi:hypothetical protein
VPEERPVTSPKKILRKIKKVAKQLGRKEREVLLQGLQEFLRQAEPLLRGKKRGATRSRRRAAKKAAPTAPGVESAEVIAKPAAGPNGPSATT